MQHLATVPTMIWHSKAAVADLQAQGRLLIGHANDALHAVERLQTPYANQYGQPQWSSAEYVLPIPPIPEKTVGWELTSRCRRATAQILSAANRADGAAHARLRSPNRCTP